MQGNVVQAMKLANDLDPTMLDRDRCVSLDAFSQSLGSFSVFTCEMKRRNIDVLRIA